MKTRELIDLLLSHGYEWYPKRGKGSHRLFLHAWRSRVVLPYHGDNAEVPPKILRNILREANLKR